MKYGIDYRYLKKGATKAVDNTSMARPVDVEIDEAQFALIPNVGDYVDLPGENDFRNIPCRGKGLRRLFQYKLGYCYVQILVQEIDEDWSSLWG